MKIAVDIDDTLNIVDRFGYASEYIKRKGLPFKLRDPHANRFALIYDWTEEDVVRFVRDEGGMVAFTDAAARKGAREALEGWRKMGHEIVILTARYKEMFISPERVSRDWLEKRKIPYDEIVADIPMADKGAYCRENGIPVLVDDDIGACLGAYENGVTAVLAIGRHNARRAREIPFGGANWTQLDAAVKRVIRLLEEGERRI